MNVKKPASKKPNTYTMVTCALLIALHVVLGRFLSIQTPVVRVGFAFVPLAISGILFGPVYGAAVGGIADLLGYVVNPMGAYHPGFTLTNALAGAVYGLLLHRKEGAPRMTNSRFLIRSVIAVLITAIPLGLCLNTLWLTQILDKGYLVMLPVRALKEIVTGAVQLVTINLVRMVLVEPFLSRSAAAHN